MRELLAILAYLHLLHEAPGVAPHAVEIPLLVLSAQHWGA